jgi:hypothetical protein
MLVSHVHIDIDPSYSKIWLKILSGYVSMTTCHCWHHMAQHNLCVIGYSPYIKNIKSKENTNPVSGITNAGMIYTVPNRNEGETEVKTGSR